MHYKELSTSAATFKLAAALERYEMDLQALGAARRDPAVFRRLQDQFARLRLLGASLPKVSVAWVAVMVSRARLLQALCGRGGAAVNSLLQEHLAAVEALRRRCLRMMGAQAVALP